MTQSIIQQGAHGSTATVNLSGAHLTQVRELIAEIRRGMDSLGLKPDTAAELRADMSSIDSQLQSPKPKRGVILEGLRSIRTILEGITANILTSSLLPKMVAVIADLSH
jgi:hypothetical protein